MRRGPCLSPLMALFSVLTLTFSAEPLPPAATGSTQAAGEEMSSVSDAVDDTGRTVCTAPPSGAETPLRAKGTKDPAWFLIQELPVFQRLAKGDAFAVQFDISQEILAALPATDPLTAKARQAVNRAPAWLQKQLEDQFSRMSMAQQNKWADVVNGAGDPYVDETAFLVAHISKDDLGASGFYAKLVRDSAEYAYEVDPFLGYVEVVDYGSAGSGGDYYTTLRYQVELDGVISPVEIPREIYYWWVLSPRGSDEFPTFIDPLPCSSGGTPAAPPTGKFWREWFFYGASTKSGFCDTDWDGAKDDPCPVLKDMLAGATVLWAHRPNTSGSANGAVGLVNEWVRRSLGTFGDKDGCRPVQPVTVYYHQDGNCGEWADLTMAAGRAALIPTEVTGTQINDHVWNEFYDHQWGRFVQWEPVNNMIDSNYSGWWGGRIAALNTYRGDGYGDSAMTPQHGPSATLTVTVYDAHHYPVDGAKVNLGSEYDPIPALIMTATRAHTNAQGQARFWVGDARNYYVQVSTPWGSYPGSGWTKVIDNAVPGTDYQFSPPDFTGSVPRLNVTPANPPGTADDYLLEVECTVTQGLTHGDSFAASIWYTAENPGDLDFFVADQANYDLFTSGAAFQAFQIALDTPENAVSFLPPRTEDYFLAWSGKAAMDMAHTVQGSVRLYRNTGAVPAVRDLRVTTNAGQAAWLDWEDVTGQNVDGYNIYRSVEATAVGMGRTEAELAPFLLDWVPVSAYEDPGGPPPGGCFFYSIRTKSTKGGISP